LEIGLKINQLEVPSDLKIRTMFLCSLAHFRGNVLRKSFILQVELRQKSTVTTIWHKGLTHPQTEFYFYKEKVTKRQNDYIFEMKLFRNVAIRRQ